MIRNLTPDDLQHLRYVIALLRSEHRNELADRLLDFAENRVTDIDKSSITLQGPIRVGDKLLWEPDNPRAREHVVVTRIQDGEPSEDTLIWTRGPRGEFWNHESRIREACIRYEPRDIGDSRHESARL